VSHVKLSGTSTIGEDLDSPVLHKIGRIREIHVVLPIQLEDLKPVLIVFRMT
jgi:hypothetical protein